MAIRRNTKTMMGAAIHVREREEGGVVEIPNNAGISYLFTEYHSDASSTTSSFSLTYPSPPSTTPSQFSLFTANEESVHSTYILVPTEAEKVPRKEREVREKKEGIPSIRRNTAPPAPDDGSISFMREWRMDGVMEGE